MVEFIKIVLESGKTALDLALYVLLPVLVVMMAIMKVVEARGVLAFIASLMKPLLRLFGVPGAGAFAIVQLLFVSFAAPLATISIMEKDGTAKRSIAATLAMILAMSQANVVFPLVTAGLNLPIIILTSLVGGFTAAAVTYYFFARSAEHGVMPDSTFDNKSGKINGSTLSLMISGGQEAVQVIIGAIPILVLSVFLVGVLKSAGVIAIFEQILAPVFTLIGFPVVAVLPLATKYMAGGTAMLGVTLNLMKEGVITAVELNRMAGFLTNPCDIVGVAVLVSAGARSASVVKPAVAGAAVGIFIRGVLHLIIF